MPVINSYINDTQLFHDLKSMDRDNFSYDGAKALMEYLDQFSDDIGENIEYDPIAFCCDYAEYTESELLSEYGYLVEDIDDAELDDLLNELNDNTTVIEFSGGYIVQSF